MAASILMTDEPVNGGVIIADLGAVIELDDLATLSRIVTSDSEAVASLILIDVGASLTIEDKP